MPRHRAAARESHWPLRRGGGRCAAAGSPLLSDAVAHVSSVHTSMPSMAQPDLQQKPRPNSARVQRRRPRRSQYALACTSVAAWPSSPSQVSRFCWLRHTETQVLPPQQRTPATDCARRTHLAPTRLASSGSVGQPRASQCCGIARSFNSEFSQQQQLQQSLPCHQRTTGHNQITALSKKSNDGSSNRYLSHQRTTHARHPLINLLAPRALSARTPTEHPRMLRLLLLVLWSLAAECALRPIQLSARRHACLRGAAATAAAAIVLSSPAVAHAKVTSATFDLAACEAKYPKAPSVCLIRQTQANSVAQNEARLARVAQCDQELKARDENGGKLPASVKPATDNANAPATCVGGPTYQLNGFGDPSLPRIY